MIDRFNLSPRTRRTRLSRPVTWYVTLSQKKRQADRLGCLMCMQQEVASKLKTWFIDIWAVSPGPIGDSVIARSPATCCDPLRPLRPCAPQPHGPQPRYPLLLDLAVIDISGEYTSHFTRKERHEHSSMLRSPSQDLVVSLCTLATRNG